MIGIKCKNKHTNEIKEVKQVNQVHGKPVYVLEKENGETDNWSEELFLLHWEVIP